jgi:GNAT superfamily N-acetyltransferase
LVPVAEYGIRPWSSHDRGEVTELIVSIQQGEFGLAITAEDQPDLADVDGFYRAGGGEFWVARCGDLVVGTIAAINIGDGQVALRKMFVHRDHRGAAGLATALMSTLLEWARSASIDTVWLGTTSVMHAAHRFYEKQGFERVSDSDLPSRFPLMHVDSVFYRRKV